MVIQLAYLDVDKMLKYIEMLDDSKIIDLLHKNEQMVLRYSHNLSNLLVQQMIKRILQTLGISQGSAIYEE
jgi:hypothetical protein